MPKTTCKNAVKLSVSIGKDGKVKRELMPEFKARYGGTGRRWIDRQALYTRDDTVRCKGCRLLFANVGSYLDHALMCEKLSKKQKTLVRTGDYLKQTGVIL
jgi:hypothetical protein